MSTPTIVDDLTVTTYTKRHGQWFARVSGPLNMDSKLARQRAAREIRAAKVAAGESLEPSFRVKTRVVSERSETVAHVVETFGTEIELIVHSYLITEV